MTSVSFSSVCSRNTSKETPRRCPLAMLELLRRLLLLRGESSSVPLGNRPCVGVITGVRSRLVIEKPWNWSDKGDPSKSQTDCGLPVDKRIELRAPVSNFSCGIRCLYQTHASSDATAEEEGQPKEHR